MQYAGILLKTTCTAKISTIVFHCSTGAKNKRVRDGSSGPVGVHNTNFYEMEGQVKVNPIGGMELENPTFEVRDSI